MASESERRIRESLISVISEEFSWGVTLHELQLRSHRAFVDVAHIDDKFHAFEIKSERDDFARLNRQTRYYNEACSECTIVVHERHGRGFIPVPSWWGIWIAYETPNGTAFSIERRAEPNPTQDSRRLARVLRSTELGRILHANDPGARVSGLSKDELVRRAYDVLGSALLVKLSLDILRTRRTWTSRQLGVATEDERLRVVQGRARPELGVLRPQLGLGATA